jgi:fumarate hydratase class II
MLPLIGHTLIQSIQLLTTCSTSLADKAIKGMQINQAKIAQSVTRNPMLVAALTSLIGYDKSAEIAKKAYTENRTVLDVAKELTNINEAVLIERLEPRAIVGDTKM